MPDTLERAEPESAGSHELVPDQRRRWSRTHTIWTLIVLSLIPGVVIALFREEWVLLPAGVRAAVYLTSAILIVAACSLILMSGDKRPNKPNHESE